jgi:signal peptidase I
MKYLKKTVKLFNIIILIFFISSAINIIAFQIIRIDGLSMEPTLHNKDIVIVNKLNRFVKAMPSYGDIVIFDKRLNKAHSIKTDISDNIISNPIFNKTEQNYCIKRVIGLPGDTLEIKNKTIKRNGKILNEPYIEIFFEYSSMKITVPQKHIFVMGDNRSNSKDSRDIGSIPLNHVIGKLLFK